MQFKDNQALNEFARAPAALKLLMNSFSDFSLSEGIQPLVTRILAPVEGESGVHQDYRAADFRDEFGGGRLYSQDQVARILSSMNSIFPRTDGKLVLIHHSFVNHEDPGSVPSPAHFHLQIPWEWKMDPIRWVPKLRARWDDRDSAGI